MTDLARVTINWTGFPGAPGYTNLYFAPAAGGTVNQAVVDAAAAKAHNWLTAWISTIPPVATVTVDPTVETIAYENGELTGFWAATPGAGRVGTGASTYSAPAGACVSWYTAGIRNGRKIRGRSFMVPLATTAYDTTGTLDATRLTSWKTATTTLIANTDAAKLAVWSRPSSSGATDGIAYDVISYQIPDKSAILTSRRD